MWVWFQAIRLRFLVSSVISAMLGAVVALYMHGSMNIYDALGVAAGVAMLHASVDLLNDYTDYKRGIDTRTQRTGMSGGSGVLPDKLLRPEQVRRAGIACMCASVTVGSYYVYIHGIIIAIILGFAVLSVYFYSTKIADRGLGEIFVSIKGGLIVLGAYYIQAAQLDTGVVLAGMAAGSLSGAVLFVASFPDYVADGAAGRRTLVVRLGPQRAAWLYWIFPGIFVGTVGYGMLSHMFPTPVAIALLALPLAISAGRGMIKGYNKPYRHMRQTLIYARLAGILMVAGFAVTPAITGAL